MEILPKEIIEIILSSPQLTFQDIIYLGTTSKHFYNIVHQSTYIWKKKYQQRYPQFIKLFDNFYNNWFAEIMNIHDFRNRTHEVLAVMATKLYKLQELSEYDFADWSKMCLDLPQAYHYIVMELKNILNDCSPIKSIKVVPINTPGNKTLQYYAMKVLRFLRQKHLTEEWLEFEELPPEKQLLEKGATMIAQWCQPLVDIEWESIAEQLDNLAKQVIFEVHNEYPNHPLLKVPQEIFIKWKLFNLDSNQWSTIECQQIITCIKRVIYVQNRFHGNSQDYYMPENSYINEVLSRKQGLPITLAVLFESVARRVGLKCEPYAFTSHFLLKFTEGNSATNYGESYYIDVFNHGNKIRKGSCPAISQAPPNKYIDPETATTQQVVERMANNLEKACRLNITPTTHLSTLLRSVLELIVTVSKQDLESVVALARLYMMHGIDTTPLEKFLVTYRYKYKVPEQAMGIINMLHDYDLHRQHNFTEPITQPKCKSRSKNVLYAVGMIVRHVGLNCSCVICDWDLECLATYEWQLQLSITNLKYGRCQPFYQVLVADGTHHYVPQEYLTSTQPHELLSLDDIGRHFSHYFETHYVPNAEKEAEYPADAEIRYRFHQKVCFGS